MKNNIICTLLVICCGIAFNTSVMAKDGGKCRGSELLKCKNQCKGKVDSCISGTENSCQCKL